MTIAGMTEVGENGKTMSKAIGADFDSPPKVHMAQTWIKQRTTPPEMSDLSLTNRDFNFLVPLTFITGKQCTYIKVLKD